MDNKNELLRKIPKIDEVLQEERLFFFMETTPRTVVVESVREVIESLRNDIIQGKRQEIWVYDSLLDEIVDRIEKKKQRNLRQVINATGVILHTNLGRAILPERAIDYLTQIAGGYSNLEYDLEKGARGSRHQHVEKLICTITGAEAAMVVNNNAAATLLCLSAMARGKEVVVSRGELVEIGGSFRIPEIMEESKAILREVGTTNKTKPSDYEKAYLEGVTGAFLKVHTSNYRIVGFTEEVALPELVALGKEKALPVIYDMGSGLLVDLKEYGVDEPTVPQALEMGVDVVLFSGDKLLGSSQGGIIVGKKEYIEGMKKHPLARAFRVDKMILSAMEATFFEYLDVSGAMEKIPVLRMITTPKQVLLDKANELCRMIAEEATTVTGAVAPCQGQIGGGTAPTVYLDGYAVVLEANGVSPEKIEHNFRKAEPPVIVRIAQDKVLLDVRTIQEVELPVVAKLLGAMGF